MRVLVSSMPDVEIFQGRHPEFVQRILSKMILLVNRPVLLAGRGVEKQVFFTCIHISFQVPAKVQTIMIESCIRILHSLAIKNNTWRPTCHKYFSRLEFKNHAICMSMAVKLHNGTGSTYDLYQA